MERETRITELSRRYLRTSPAIIGMIVESRGNNIFVQNTPKTAVFWAFLLVNKVATQFQMDINNAIFVDHNAVNQLLKNRLFFLVSHVAPG